MENEDDEFDEVEDEVMLQAAAIYQVSAVFFLFSNFYHSDFIFVINS